MKNRLVLSLAILSSLITLLLVQVSQVKAVSVLGGGPVTPPITSAVYTLSGNVTLRLLRTSVPLNGLFVTAYDTVNKVFYHTKTDSAGNYSFSLNNGTYLVATATGSAEIAILPKYQTATVSGQNVPNISFSAFPLK